MPCKEQLRTIKNELSLYRSCTASLEPKTLEKGDLAIWAMKHKDDFEPDWQPSASAPSGQCSPGSDLSIKDAFGQAFL